MKKLLIIVLLLIIFVLSGCAPSVKSEKEMKMDVQNYINSFGEPYCEVEKLNIIERKTSKKDGTDVVNVEYVATTEYSEGIYSLVLNYKLYEQGWFFENAQIDSKGKREVKPTKEPKQSIVEEIMFKEYPDAKFKDKEILLDDNKCIYYYQNISNKKYAKVDSIISLTFKFNTDTLEWTNIIPNTANPCIIESRHTWDIIGTWYPVDEQSVYGRKGFVMYITENGEEGVRITTQLNGTVYYDSIVSFDELDRKRGHSFETWTAGNLRETISIIPSYVGTSHVYFPSTDLPFERR